MSSGDYFSKAITDLYKNLHTDTYRQQSPFFGVDRLNGIKWKEYTESKYTLSIPTPDQVAAAKLELARLESLIPEYKEMVKHLECFAEKVPNFSVNLEPVENHFVSLFTEQKTIISRATHTWNFEDQKCSKCNSDYWVCENGEYTCDEMIVKNIIE